MMGRNRSRYFELALSLAVFAIVLRIVVPAGTMLDLASATSGKLQLVICTGDGLKTVSVDPDSEPHAPSPAHGDGKCAFAAAASALADAVFFPRPAALRGVHATVAWSGVWLSQIGLPVGARAPPIPS